MRLLCFLAFIFVVLGLMGGKKCMYSGYKISVSKLHLKAESILTQIIEMDVEKRSEALKGEAVFGTYTSAVKSDSLTLFTEQGQQKYKKEELLSKVEGMKKALYTILPRENPICIDSLNGLFYQEVQKADLKIVFALSIVDVLTGDTIHSDQPFIDMLTVHSDSLKIKTPENHTVILHAGYDLFSVIAGIDYYYWFKLGVFSFIVLIGVGILVWKKFRSGNKEAIEMAVPIRGQEAVQEEAPEAMLNTLETEAVPEESAQSEPDILRDSNGKLTLCLSTRKLSTTKGTIRLSKKFQLWAIQALLKAEQLSLPKDTFMCNAWNCQHSSEITENAFTTGISRLNATLRVLHLRVMVTEDTVSLSLIG